MSDIFDHAGDAGQQSLGMHHTPFTSTRSAKRIPSMNQLILGLKILEHADLSQASVSASGAKRWTKCTASPKFIAVNKGIIQDEERDYTTDGIKAHNVSAAILLGDPIPKRTSPQMLKHCNDYADFCRKQQDNSRVHQVFVEAEIPVFFRPSRKGFVDFAVIDIHGIHIVDLKYGEGVKVYAQRNHQMAIYAVSLIVHHVLAEGIWDLTEDTPIDMSIYQPRHRTEPGVDTWKTTWGQLYDFVMAEIVEPAIRILANSDDVMFSPGEDTCQFCPAETICKARLKWMLAGCPSMDSLTKEGFKLPDKGVLTREETGRLLAMRGKIKTFLDDLWATELAKAHEGHPPPGWKLVAGNGSYWWEDEAKAKALLSKRLPPDIVVKTTMISPSAAKTALKAAEADEGFMAKLEPLIVRSDGKPTLAPAASKREEVQPDAVLGFSNLDAADIYGDGDVRLFSRWDSDDEK